MGENKNSRRHRLLRCIIVGSLLMMFYNGLTFPKLSSSHVEPEGMDLESFRKLSIDHGDGTCEWRPPAYVIPEFIDFHKTIISGYPSGDKRLAYAQLEALTGWSARDEWAFMYDGMTNHPFIKANYPHHEGIWGWQDVADQSILIVRDMKTSMAEYHDILWDIGYAKSFEEAFNRTSNLYVSRPPLEDFLSWRDSRVLDEIHWYGWHTDYWMEGGLMRDIFTHNITTPNHWNLIRHNTLYNRNDASYKAIVGNDTVIPSYDLNCLEKVSGGCQPVSVISAKGLTEQIHGPVENRKIAQSLVNKPGISEYLLDESVWECIWTELIVNKKGFKVFIDREGFDSKEYNFSEEMLEEMIAELTRLIDKYSTNLEPNYWYSKQTARDLVEHLTDHRSQINEELLEIQSGSRKLREIDFLGPIERAKRKSQKLAKILEEKGKATYNREMEIMNEDYSKFFDELGKQIVAHRTQMHKEEAFEASIEEKINLFGLVK